MTNEAQNVEPLTMLELTNKIREQEKRINQLEDEVAVLYALSFSAAIRTHDTVRDIYREINEINYEINTGVIL